MISGNRAGTHFGEITSAYLNRRRHRVLLLIVVLVVTTGMGAYAVAHGTFHISIKEMVLALFGNAEDNVQVVITRIRLPRVVAAVFRDGRCPLPDCASSLCSETLSAPRILWGSARVPPSGRNVDCAFRCGVLFRHGVCIRRCHGCDGGHSDFVQTQATFF